MKLHLHLALLAMLCLALPSFASESNAPEGWATCATTTTAGDYDLSGGGDGSLIVLRSDGSDMRNKIHDAILNHDVVVFDGKYGDFVLSASVSFSGLTNRTLIGINGAKFRTVYTVPKEVHELLDAIDAKTLNSKVPDFPGGNLSNGSFVAEYGELTIRQTLIDYYGDPKETYRNSGVFIFNGCSNIIIRNLDFQGPGAIDLGAADLITLITCDHIWVDHCRFTDGMDGNLDVGFNSDFITLSDCHFGYSELSYNHPLSNLTSGTELTDGSPQKCNVSWIRCFWDEGCSGRMPYTALGIHHILNCFWECTKGTCIDAHNLSKIRLEKSYFRSNVRTPLAVRDNNVVFDVIDCISESQSLQRSNSTVTVPYSYDSWSVWNVASKIKKTAGPTLTEPFTRELSVSPSVIDFGNIYADCEVATRFTVSAFGEGTPAKITLTAPEGILLSKSLDGEYSQSIAIEADDDILLQSDIYLKATFTHPGNADLKIEATTSLGASFSIPVSADVTALSGEKIEATLLWPFDKGASGSVEAVKSQDDLFTTASFSLGDHIYIHSARNIDEKTFTLFNPSDAIKEILDKECSITFTIDTSDDYIFVPKTLKFDASRMNTDMCHINVECSRDEGTPVTLIASYQPARNNATPAFSEVELPLTNAGVGKRLQVTIYLYNILANKQLALSNLRIEGDVYAVRSALPIITRDETGSETYFDLMGRVVANPVVGTIYIHRNASGKTRLEVFRN